MSKQSVFDVLLNNPPLRRDGTRNLGCRAYEWFWKGVDGVGPKPVPDSLGEAAWKAGKAYAQLEVCPDCGGEE